MECQCTKTAASKTSPVADQTEFDLPDCRNSTCRLIRWMVGPHVRKCVDIIHLLLGQRFCRRVLYHIQMIRIGLNQPLSGKWICVAVLSVKAFGVQKLIFFHLFIRFQNLCIIHTVQILDLADRSIDIGNVLDIQSGIQCLCNLNDRAFAHSIRNQVCTRIQKNGTLKLIGPVIIMCKSSKTRLDTTQNDWCLLICLTDQIAVHNCCIIRSLSHHSARCIRILLPSFL